MQRLARRAMSSSMTRLAASVERPAYETWRISPPIAGNEGDSKTYAHQSSLPALPVPDLKETLRKLRASGRAVARDEQEQRTFEGALDEFEGGELAQALQKRLKAKADKPGVRNWLAEDWDRLAYMSYRDSVVCNVSYFYGFHRLPQRIDGVDTREQDKADPAYVAASIAAYALWHRDELAHGNISADTIGKSQVDMESFKWLYNACRIPSPGEDYAVKVKEDDTKGDHFIVIRQNRFYKVKFRDDQGKRASLDALYQVIRQIYRDAPSRPDPPLGVLTGVNRDTWAEARAHLIKDAENSESLRLIEDAAFMICLDADTPSTVGNDPIKRADFSAKLWKGNARCRFYDKPLQWVVFDSGESGIIGEHSCMDGTPTASLNDQMTKDLIAGKRPPEPAEATQTQLKPEAIKFNFDQKSLDSIAAAEKEYEAHVNSFDLRYLLFEEYGKDSIKACKTSPDGWVQMVMQLAYALTHDGQPAPTYESAQTRRFALGRTEVVRVCTEASRAWTASMLKPDTDAVEKRKLFRAAVEQQGKDMKDASAALGVDRHLLGLKRCLSPKDVAPALFGDPVFVRSSHWQMSTSQVYGRQFSAYGWGPVVEDGYGLPYMIHPESLMFTITAHKGMPIERMLSNIESLPYGSQADVEREESQIVDVHSHLAPSEANNQARYGCDMIDALQPELPVDAEELRWALELDGLVERLAETEAGRAEHAWNHCRRNVGDKGVTSAMAQAKLQRFAEELRIAPFPITELRIALFFVSCGSEVKTDEFELVGDALAMLARNTAYLYPSQREPLSSTLLPSVIEQLVQERLDGVESTEGRISPLQTMILNEPLLLDMTIKWVVPGHAPQFFINVDGEHLKASSRDVDGLLRAAEGFASAILKVSKRHQEIDDHLAAVEAKMQAKVSKQVEAPP